MVPLKTMLKIVKVAAQGQLNPISAGVLENQDMLGGGQFDPPL